MPENAIWVALVFGAVVLGYTLIHRSTPARRRPAVDSLVMRLGLPVDEHIIALIDRRVRSTVIGSCVAGFIALAVAAVLLVAGGGLPEGLASTLLGLVFAAAVSLGTAAGGAGYFAPQAAQSVRIARAQTPRLNDYLHPLWRWASIGVTVAAVLLCGAILAGAGATSGLIGVPMTGVVVATALAIAAQFGASLLGRRLLDVPQPAREELELQWDDALRGMTVRSLWIAAFTIAWAAALLALLWLLAATPTVTVWFGFVALVPILLLSVPASRRVERRMWTDVVSA
ncbi:hypothetical protein EV379_1740 [Microterricola gilva]|uniref:Uncharacterized protein n=1 Tax=Microterricola gilva TaxID=393267 RepID=A0A4V2GAS6_9MICO|nr:hypothetical protein [Microterricola gilva]RZU65406.1 hypothetical protein EV379_1740 [Microterricola gilva]